MEQSLEKRFQTVRRRIEGLRPRLRFETTYFMPLEEELGCVPVNPWHTRIMSELDFCLQMKAYAGTEVTGPVDAALRVLEEAYQKDGVLTDGACEQAEQCLMPLAEESHTYKLIVVGHAHLDMNWKWGWDETVATVVSTFRTMLKLMEEYPEFHYSQSQASTYKIVEEYAPDMMPEIKKRIQEGRWEVLASTWVENDKNMPCTESLQNQILYAKKYLEETWGVPQERIEIDFAPDTFGHSAFIPEIDALGGLKYCYHGRGFLDNEKVLYRWKAPSGKELLMYKEPYWYSSGMVPYAGIGLPRVASMSGGLRTGLMAFGVGNHGGGPTRRDLNKAEWMKQWPIFPRMHFGTMREYFLEAERVREKLPVVEHELNAVFTGCYTTQSRIKRGNRRAETALLQAEKLCALVAGSTEKALEGSWQDTLLTHFHDILTGSCVQDTREHAMGVYQKVLAHANTRSAQALEELAACIDTSALIGISEAMPEDAVYSRAFGAGVGYGLGQGNIPSHETGNGMTRIFHIVNTTGCDREENAKLTIWDWPGNLALMEITDERGNVLPSECISGQQIFWQHRYFEALVTVKVPAYGYTTVVLQEKSPEIETDCFINTNPFARKHAPIQDMILENEYLCARFDARSSDLYSLVDKVSGTERIPEGKRGGLRYIIAQKNQGMSSWIIERWVDVKPIAKTVKIEPIGGKLRCGFQVVQEVASSQITTTVTLGSKDRYLKVQTSVDWKEESKDSKEQPLLSYCLPLKEASGRMLCDVPGGTVWRPDQEIDMPCQRYAAAEFQDGRVLTLAADCKHGFRLSGNELFVTLINTAEHPDPYPERGIHEISLFIMPAAAKAAELSANMDICLNPLQYVINTPHEGTLPMTGQLLDTKGETAVFTGVAERKGYLAVRMYEAEGKICPVTVTLNKPVSEAFMSDLFGNKLDIPVKAAGQQVQVTLAPFVQGELRIK